MHHRNAAERTISTFKDHFNATMAGQKIPDAPLEQVTTTGRNHT